MISKWISAFLGLFTLWEPWFKSRKMHLEPLVLYFQLTQNLRYIHGKDLQLVSASLRLIPDLVCLSATGKD